MQKDTGLDIPQAAENLEISPELYKRLARLFLDDTTEQLSNLKSAIEQENGDEIAAIAHHIAGSAENLELFAVGNAARRIMVGARANEETGSLKDNYREVKRQFVEIQKELAPHR